MPARTRQRPDLAGAHEALLLDELAGGVRRHAGSLQGLDERSALVLLHGWARRRRLTIDLAFRPRVNRTAQFPVLHRRTH